MLVGTSVSTQKATVQLQFRCEQGSTPKSTLFQVQGDGFYVWLYRRMFGDF